MSVNHFYQVFYHFTNLIEHRLRSFQCNIYNIQTNKNQKNFVSVVLRAGDLKLG